MCFERARAAGRTWRLLCALVAGAGAAACPTPCAAQSVPEHALKAAFIYNFAVFTEWPAEFLPGGAPIAVCASSGSALYGALQQLGDKQVNGHRIALRPALPPLRSCHVLVLERDGPAHPERRDALKRELAGAAVLTVADDSAAGADGAVIALALEERRIVFDIDLQAARHARLTLSSKLLRLARTVQ